MLRLRTFALLFLPLLAAAQTQDTTSGSAMPWITLGGTIGFHGFNFMESKTSTNTLSDTASFKSQNENLGNRFALGAEAHFQFLRRWGAATGFQFRTADFRLTNTTTVNSKDAIVKERTRFQAWEAPLLVRRFNKPHDETGWRWFYQAGPSLRRITNVRSERQTTATDGKVTCCDETPAATKNTTALGFTAGAGLTSRDQFGVRVTPELRYTRWMQRSFDHTAARSSVNQIEVVLGFYFR